MTSKTSRKSRISLIRPDGSVEALPLRAPLFSPQLVILARERCLFECVEINGGISQRAAAQAARIHAETAAPYLRSGHLITRQGSKFGVWWWDAAFVAERLALAGLDPAARILPEPMARAGAEGWRVVKASSGYEAQAWKNGFLVADQWRRRPFDADAWRDFVRVLPERAGADDAVLMAQDPPFTLRAPYRRTVVSTWTNERMGTTAAVAVGIALIGLSAYFVGETIGLNRASDRMEAEAKGLAAKAGARQADMTGAASLAALRKATDFPDPVVMLENAQRAVEPFGHKLVAFDADSERVRIVLPEAAIAEVGPISAQLEASPYFSQVRPAPPGRDKQRLTIDMTPAGAKPKAKTQGRVAGATTSLDGI